MKIFLTGSTGMVGRNILNHVKSKDYEFFVPTRSECNLLDKNAVNQYIKIHNFNFIIHAGGVVGGIHANLLSNFNFLYENIQIGLNVINAAYNNNVKNLINLGSSCMYPRNISESINEDLILKGELEPTNEGYAVAKIAVAKYCQFISEKHPELNYKNLIPCNLYGRWDNFTIDRAHMIPSVIAKIHAAKQNNSQAVEIWGDGKARREFMYADDCADAIFFCIKNFNKLDLYTNVGLGVDLDILGYYKTIAKVLKYEGDFYFNLSKPVGMNRKLLNVNKLNSLGWKASFNLESGIELTYNYYLNLLNNNL